jgi:adenine-specific DNA-methyltransferase
MSEATHLFNNSKFEIPKTEGIKYAGSKLKILPYIFDMISKIEVYNVLDGFSGSTRVSQALAKAGFKVTSSDISVWSETFAKAYMLNTKKRNNYEELIDYLNSLQGYEGWFSEHYGGRPENKEKRPFQLKNTKKLDAIRDEIDRLNLDEISKSVALTSLILALDSVDNTLGHYVSYLANWSLRSYNDMKLQVPMLFENKKENIVLKGDIFDTIKGRTYDLAYFDPPYGSNNDKMPPSRIRYNSYYHIWTSVILNDKPNLFGKSNRREDSRDKVTPSVFEEFRKDENGHFIAMQAIKKLINETNSKYVLLSYSSGGRASKEELFDIINYSGKLIKAVEIDYKKNVMAQMRWTNEWTNNEKKHIEYLFLIEKH